MSEANLIVCTSCGAVNGVPDNRDATSAKCGKCKKPLLSPEPRQVSGDVFARVITRSTLPVVVDFWAPWCGPCRMMAPQFADAAAKHHGEVMYLKLNTEDDPKTAAMYNIRSIPTMVLFQNGKELNRTSGAMDANRIHYWINSSLEK